MSVLINMRYNRVPGEHVYIGRIEVTRIFSSGDYEDEGPFAIKTFQNEDLQVVGTKLYHLLQFLLSATEEIQLVLTQGTHKSVLTLEQVQQIAESEESAREFFAPTIIRR